MKVKELRTLLADWDGELEVKFAYNYGDHWRTTVARDIEKIELEKVEYSDYHSMDKVLTGEDDDSHWDEEKQIYVEKDSIRRAVVLQ